MTSICRFSMSVIRTWLTLAGDNALAAKTEGSSDHSMMSIFSPRNSRMIACTREPFIPTHAPTGSTSGSFEATAILARDRKSTRLNSSHTVIYTLSLHDALPISPQLADDSLHARALHTDARTYGVYVRIV